MLGRRYLQIQFTPIPNPVEGFNKGFTADETVNLSEAGTELVRVRRLNKRVFRGTWHLSSFWLKKFEEWASEPVVVLTYQGEQYNVRMRDFSSTLQDNSEWTETSEGLWIVTVTFTEI